MGEEDILKVSEKTSRMFTGEGKVIKTDEQLALHIMHRFNIDRETMECMPAFEPHIKPLFCLKKEK